MIVPILVCLVLFLGFLWWREARQKKNLEREVIEEKNEIRSIKELSDSILYNVDAYIILANRNFLVEKTNYYNLTNTTESQVMCRVGELLHCKNALDAGECGAHENCKMCPVRNAIEKCFRENGHFSQLETPMRLYLSEKTDNYIDCVVSVSGTYLQLNNDDKVLLTVRDVTRQKKVRDELEAAKQEAELAGEQKTAFLANMSHEIRTPLNAIVGFSGLLVDTEDKEERSQYMSIVQENTELLLQLISDILDLSKIESGTFEIVKGKVDVNVLCSEIVRSLSMKAPEGVELRFDDHLPQCIICSDKNRLTQVISNFINNALKFTFSGFISLSYCEVDGEFLKFSVRDTGTGIPADKVNTIFDRFVKLNTFVHGTGLGLSICKSIVEQMGGSIGVESKEGEGSCFWFVIPK